MGIVRRERTFWGSRLPAFAWGLLALASLSLASCGGTGSLGDVRASGPVQVKAEPGISERDAVELAKKEFTNSNGALNASDCRVTGVRAATVQREPVWIVTLRHQGMVVPGEPLEMIVNKRTGEAHLAPKK